MNDIATAEDTARAVERPLAVLVPLIKKDLALGREAAEQASIPYFTAAGAKMIEAKPQMKHGEFGAWIKREFGISADHATNYMKLARATSDAQNLARDQFSSLNDFRRQHLGHKRESAVHPQPWHEPIKATLNRVNVERHEQTPVKKSDERVLQRALALQLIDIGFKALSTKLHPDRGGSKEAMQRLNAVKMKLKIAVEKL